ncbi:MAG TPA: hypothetical protein VK196_19500 [Magnetospirillum sp.]|nr:hypothetical protein [Magnetospirillum sp.]
MALFLLFLVGTLAGHMDARAAEGPAKITEIVPIILKNATTSVDNFAPDQHRGMIVRAWRDTGNAHGYYRYMVMVEGGGDRKPWHLATIDTHDQKRGERGPEMDTIRDAPHTFEDIVESVKFARAKVNGEPRTLMIVAIRDTGKADSLADKTPVDVEFYQLTIGDEEDGTPPYYFDRIQAVRVKGTYSNADCALAKEVAAVLGPSAAVCGP